MYHTILKSQVLVMSLKTGMKLARVGGKGCLSVTGEQNNSTGRKFTFSGIRFG